MTPLNYDLFIGIVCSIAGLYMLYKIGAFTKKIYTPALSGIAVFIGLMAWSILALVSYSGIFEHPVFLYSEGWFGSWGYTSSRILMAIMWLLMLVQIDHYAPKCKQTVKAEL